MCFKVTVLWTKSVEIHVTKSLYSPNNNRSHRNVSSNELCKFKLMKSKFGLFFVILVGPMYGTNSGSGAGFSEASHGPNPAFPTSNTPDFLSSLSQMGDNLLPSDRLMGNGNHPRTPMDGQTTNPRTPNDGGQMCHARTPLDNQIGHVHTPMDGTQLSHPRTPVDGQLCPSRASLDSGQSGQGCLTSEGQNGGHLLRHGAPGTPGSLGNPLTPASCSSGRTCRNGSAEFGANSVCSSGNNNNNTSNVNSVSESNNGGSANNSSSSVVPVQCSSSISLFSNTLANNSFAGQQQQQPQSLSSGNSIDSGFSTDLGFHTSALIDGDSMTGQESLDVSLCCWPSLQKFPPNSNN